MSVAGITIRPIVADEVEQVIVLDQRISKRSRRGFYLKRFAATTTAPDAFVWLTASAGGEVVGFVSAHLLDGEFGGSAPTAVIDALGTAPEQRGQGVARALMAAFDQTLKARGVTQVFSEADWSEHEIIRFFGAAGFRLASELVLEAPTTSDLYAEIAGDDESLSRDRIPVRSMAESDLPAIIRVDRKVTGRDRSGYYNRKLAEVLKESDVRISLVGEIDGEFAGFVMARVNYGEYGRTATTAVLDTIGVLPAFAHRSVGLALMSRLLGNLKSLQVETVHTRVRWNQYGLTGFLERVGFRPTQRLTLSRSLG